jgi:hypothetical protein
MSTNTPTTKKESDSSGDISYMQTTDTMRKKAEFVKKSFLCILRCLRFGKCSKPSKNVHKADNVCTNQIRHA